MTQKYTFKNITRKPFRWHTELGEGDSQDDYFEYIWFDAPLDGGYYFLVSCFSATAKGSYGITKSGVPSISLYLRMPDGNVIEVTKQYDSKAFKPLPFGGEWGSDTFIGKLNNDATAEGCKIKMSIGGVDVDLRARTVAMGVQFVEDDEGYSYYNPAKKQALGWWPLIPRMEVEGTITVNGNKITVTGPAYCDRQAGNLKDAFGDVGQVWWTWGHFWAGPYTATFTDSAPSEHYRLRHFSPFMLWKGSDLVLATYDFTCYIERYDIHPQSGRLLPVVISQRAYDGSTEFRCQVKNGIWTNTTNLDINYARQLAEVNMQLKRFGNIEEEAKGKMMIEFGAGKSWFPWDKLKK